MKWPLYQRIETVIDLITLYVETEDSLLLIILITDISSMEDYEHKKTNNK